MCEPRVPSSLESPGGKRKLSTVRDLQVVDVVGVRREGCEKIMKGEFREIGRATSQDRLRSRLLPEASEDQLKEGHDMVRVVL